jgi:4-fold beta flower protein
VFDQLFDRDRKPVGWTDGRYVFDCDPNWVAFATQGHAFSASDLAWLGPVDGHSYQDRRGKVVCLEPAEAARELPCGDASGPSDQTDGASETAGRRVETGGRAGTAYWRLVRPEFR